jgi:hypothetical protein
VNQPRHFASAEERAYFQRMTRSAFGADGRMHEGAQQGSEFSLGEYLDLSTIPWAPDPYGSDHSQWLSRLVDYMTELPGKFGGVPGGPLDKHDRRVLHAVSMLYCVGRKEGEHRYNERSAAFADTYFRSGAGQTWASGGDKERIREDVCRLIYRHNDPASILEDKRLQILADGCRYELARFSPNTIEGQLLLKENIKPDLFFTGWAQSKDNFRAWMVTRGWK